MAKYQCPSCGYPLNGNEQSCPECKQPLRPASTPSSTSASPIDLIDEDDPRAENILRRWLKWIRICLIIGAILSGAACVIAGIFAASSPYGEWWQALVGILAGAFLILIGIALAWIIWAMGMIFVNISTNVRSVKNMMKIKL